MARRQAGGFRLGTVVDIEIVVDWSLTIIFSLIVVTLATGVFPQWHPDWSGLQITLLALTAAVLFFASLLLHELAHAVIGRMHGVVIRRITLFMFGGMAQMENEPRTWRAELRMALAGPVVSLAIGFSLLALALRLGGPLPLAAEDAQSWLERLNVPATLCLWLGTVNMMLGVFNLIPGFPMDGGRVLRAVLWAWSGDLRRATGWAARAGQGFAWVFIASGVLMVFGLRLPLVGGGLIGGLWLALIGWFLYNAAVTSVLQLRLQRHLQALAVERLMQPAPPALDPRQPLTILVDSHLMPGGPRAFPVERNGELLGMVCVSDLGKLPRHDWEQVMVGEVMTPRDQLVAVTPQTDAATAVALLNRHRFNQLAVIEGGVLRGLLRREDILVWLARNDSLPA